MEITFTDEAKQAEELGTALQRLETNEDFKKVILDSYLKRNPLASALKTSYVYTRNPEYILEDLKAASNLSFFLDKVRGDYEDLKKSIEEYEEGQIDG